MVQGVHAGMVSVNDFGVYYATSLPFGGTKGSGYGRFGGEEGLRGLCNVKAVCTDRVGWVRTGIPEVVDYPIRDVGRAGAFVKGVVLVGYASGVRWWVGVWRLMRGG